MLRLLLLALPVVAGELDVRVLSTLPEGAELARVGSQGEGGMPPVAWSLELDRVAYAARGDRRAWLVVDERVHPADSVEFLGFGDDGREVLSITREDGKDVLRRDLEELARHDRIEPPRLSPRGGRLAYAARDGGRSFVVVDGRRGPEGTEAGTPVFSPDGVRVAYWLRSGREAVLMVDGRERKRVPAPREGGLAGVEEPVFSHDGRRLGFGWRRPDGESVVVVDGAEGAPFKDVGRLVFSPDGRRWMHSASRDAFADHSVLVVDGRAVESAASPEPGAPLLRFARVWPYRFDPAGRPVYLAGLADGKEVLVRDARPSKPWDGATMPIRSSAGREAFVVRVGTAQFVVLDGAPQPAYAAIADLAFGPDGGPAYAAVKDGRSYAVGGGKVHGPHDELGLLRFAPDGTLGYWARDGARWTVRLGGEAAGPAAERAGLLLLAGSPPVPVTTYQDRDGWRLGVGSRVFGPYDEIGPTLLEGSEVRAGVRVGREFRRLRLSLSQGPSSDSD